MTVFLAIIDWLGALAPQIWQAIIAGTIVAVGWIVNGAGNRRAARRRRNERLRDVHRALFAEIRAVRTALEGPQSLADHGAAILGMMKADSKFIPFIPREENSQIFGSIINEIHILPRTSIDAVVTFYGQIQVIDALAEDMRGQAFKALPQTRRRAIYADYVELKTRAYILADHAMAVIEAFAIGGDENAKKVDADRRAAATKAAQLNPNTLDAGQTGQATE